MEKVKLKKKKIFNDKKSELEYRTVLKSLNKTLFNFNKCFFDTKNINECNSNNIKVYIIDNYDKYDSKKINEISLKWNNFFEYNDYNSIKCHEIINVYFELTLSNQYIKLKDNVSSILEENLDKMKLIDVCIYLSLNDIWSTEILRKYDCNDPLKNILKQDLIYIINNIYLIKIQNKFNDSNLIEDLMHIFNIFLKVLIRKYELISINCLINLFYINNFSKPENKMYDYISLILSSLIIILKDNSNDIEDKKDLINIFDNMTKYYISNSMKTSSSDFIESIQKMINIGNVLGINVKEPIYKFNTLPYETISSLIIKELTIENNKFLLSISSSFKINIICNLKEIIMNLIENESLIDILFRNFLTNLNYWKYSIHCCRLRSLIFIMNKNKRFDTSFMNFFYSLDSLNVIIDYQKSLKILNSNKLENNKLILQIKRLISLNSNSIINYLEGIYNFFNEFSCDLSSTKIVYLMLKIIEKFLVIIVDLDILNNNSSLVTKLLQFIAEIVKKNIIFDFSIIFSKIIILNFELFKEISIKYNALDDNKIKNSVIYLKKNISDLFINKGIFNNKKQFYDYVEIFMNSDIQLIVESEIDFDLFLQFIDEDIKKEEFSKFTTYFLKILIFSLKNDRKFYMKIKKTIRAYIDGKNNSKIYFLINQINKCLEILDFRLFYEKKCIKDKFQIDSLKMIFIFTINLIQIYFSNDQLLKENLKKTLIRYLKFLYEKIEGYKQHFFNIILKHFVVPLFNLNSEYSISNENVLTFFLDIIKDDSLIFKEFKINNMKNVSNEFITIPESKLFVNFAYEIKEQYLKQCSIDEYDDPLYFTSNKNNTTNQLVSNWRISNIITFYFDLKNLFKDLIHEEVDYCCYFIQKILRISHSRTKISEIFSEEIHQLINSQNVNCDFFSSLEDKSTLTEREMSILARLKLLEVQLLIIDNPKSNLIEKIKIIVITLLKKYNLSLVKEKSSVVINKTEFLTYYLIICKFLDLLKSFSTKKFLKKLENENFCIDVKELLYNLKLDFLICHEMKKCNEKSKLDVLKSTDNFINDISNKKLLKFKNYNNIESEGKNYVSKLHTNYEAEDYVQNLISESEKINYNIQKKLNLTYFLINNDKFNRNLIIELRKINYIHEKILDTDFEQMYSKIISQILKSQTNLYNQVNHENINKIESYILKINREILIDNNLNQICNSMVNFNCSNISYIKTLRIMKNAKHIKEEEMKVSSYNFLCEHLENIFIYYLTEYIIYNNTLNEKENKKNLLVELLKDRPYYRVKVVNDNLEVNIDYKNYQIAEVISNKNLKDDFLDFQNFLDRINPIKNKKNKKDFCYKYLYLKYLSNSNLDDKNYDLCSIEKKMNKKMYSFEPNILSICLLNKDCNLEMNKFIYIPKDIEKLYRFDNLNLDSIESLLKQLKEELISEKLLNTKLLSISIDNNINSTISTIENTMNSKIFENSKFVNFSKFLSIVLNVNFIRFNSDNYNTFENSENTNNKIEIVVLGKISKISNFFNLNSLESKLQELKNFVFNLSHVTKIVFMYLIVRTTNINKIFPIDYDESLNFYIKKNYHLIIHSFIKESIFHSIFSSIFSIEENSLICEINKIKKINFDSERYLKDILYSIKVPNYQFKEELVEIILKYTNISRNRESKNQLLNLMISEGVFTHPKIILIYLNIIKELNKNSLFEKFIIGRNFDFIFIGNYNYTFELKNLVLNKVIKILILFKNFEATRIFCEKITSSMILNNSYNKLNKSFTSFYKNGMNFTFTDNINRNMKSSKLPLQSNKTISSKFKNKIKNDYKYDESQNKKESNDSIFQKINKQNPIPLKFLSENDSFKPKTLASNQIVENENKNEIKTDNKIEESALIFEKFLENNIILFNFVFSFFLFTSSNILFPEDYNDTVLKNLNSDNILPNSYMKKSSLKRAVTNNTNQTENRTHDLNEINSVNKSVNSDKISINNFSSIGTDNLKFSSGIYSTNLLNNNLNQNISYSIITSNQSALNKIINTLFKIIIDSKGIEGIISFLVKEINSSFLRFFSNRNNSSFLRKNTNISFFNYIPSFFNCSHINSYSGNGFIINYFFVIIVYGIFEVEAIVRENYLNENILMKILLNTFRLENITDNRISKKLKAFSNDLIIINSYDDKINKIFNDKIKKSIDVCENLAFRKNIILSIILSKNFNRFYDFIYMFNYEFEMISINILEQEDLKKLNTIKSKNEGSFIKKSSKRDRLQDNYTLNWINENVKILYEAISQFYNCEDFENFIIPISSEVEIFQIEKLFMYCILNKNFNLAVKIYNSILRIDKFKICEVIYYNKEIFTSIFSNIELFQILQDLPFLDLLVNNYNCMAIGTSKESFKNYFEKNNTFIEKVIKDNFIYTLINQENVKQHYLDYIDSKIKNEATTQEFKEFNIDKYVANFNILHVYLNKSKNVNFVESNYVNLQTNEIFNMMIENKNYEGFMYIYSIAITNTSNSLKLEKLIIENRLFSNFINNLVIKYNFILENFYNYKNNKALEVLHNKSDYYTKRNILDKIDNMTFLEYIMYEHLLKNNYGILETTESFMRLLNTLFFIYRGISRINKYFYILSSVNKIGYSRTSVNNNGGFILILFFMNNIKTDASDPFENVNLSQLSKKFTYNNAIQILNPIFKEDELNLITTQSLEILIHFSSINSNDFIVLCFVLIRFFKFSFTLEAINNIVFFGVCEEKYNAAVNQILESKDENLINKIKLNEKAYVILILILDEEGVQIFDKNFIKFLKDKCHNKVYKDSQVKYSKFETSNKNIENNIELVNEQLIKTKSLIKTDSLIIDKDNSGVMKLNCSYNKSDLLKFISIFFEIKYKFNVVISSFNIDSIKNFTGLEKLGIIDYIHSIIKKTTFEYTNTLEHDYNNIRDYLINIHEFNNMSYEKYLYKNDYIIQKDCIYSDKSINYFNSNDFKITEKVTDKERISLNTLMKKEIINKSTCTLNLKNDISLLLILMIEEDIKIKNSKEKNKYSLNLSNNISINDRNNKSIHGFFKYENNYYHYISLLCFLNYDISLEIIQFHLENNSNFLSFFTKFIFKCLHKNNKFDFDNIFNNYDKEDLKDFKDYDENYEFSNNIKLKTGYTTFLNLNLSHLVFPTVSKLLNKRSILTLICKLFIDGKITQNKSNDSSQKNIFEFNIISNNNSYKNYNHIEDIKILNKDLKILLFIRNYLFDRIYPNNNAIDPDLSEFDFTNDVFSNQIINAYYNNSLILESFLYDNIFSKFVIESNPISIVDISKMFLGMNIIINDIHQLELYNKHIGSINKSFFNSLFSKLLMNSEGNNSFDNSSLIEKVTVELISIKKMFKLFNLKSHTNSINVIKEVVMKESDKLSISNFFKSYFDLIDFYSESIRNFERLDFTKKSSTFKSNVGVNETLIHFTNLVLEEIFSYECYFSINRKLWFTELFLVNNYLASEFTCIVKKIKLIPSEKENNLIKNLIKSYYNNNLKKEMFSFTLNDMFYIKFSDEISIDKLISSEGKEEQILIEVYGISQFLYHDIMLKIQSFSFNNSDVNLKYEELNLNFNEYFISLTSFFQKLKYEILGKTNKSTC